VRDVKSHFLLSFPVRLIITFEKIYQYVVGVFNKTIIPFALVGYEKVIANSAAPRWLSTISYPTRAHGIIVNYQLR